jgi:dipeptidyl aminopeptidase/acylaminoacyl peptidase
MAQRDNEDTRRFEVYRAYLTRDELVSSGTVPPRWTADGTGLWRIGGAAEGVEIQRIDLRDGTTDEPFDNASVRRTLAAATDGMENAEPSFSAFADLGNGRIVFDYGGQSWILDAPTSTIGPSSRSEPESDPRIWLGHAFPYIVEKEEMLEVPSPDGQWFLSVRDNNLILRSTQHDAIKQVTSDGIPDRYWDLHASHVTDPRPQPNVWSPDSQTVLAYIRDIEGVFRMPKIDWLNPVEEVTFIPYQKAGGKLDRFDPVLLDVQTGHRTPVKLETSEDRYVFFLGWHPAPSPDRAEAFLIVYTRDFKQLEIVAVARATGDVRLVLREQAPTFVKVQHEAFSRRHGFHALPDGTGFLWLSTRSGWNHIYSYDWTGNLVGELTQGEWPVRAINHVGRDGFVYFTASPDQDLPYDLHVCRVALEGGPTERLTHERGIHNPSFAPSGNAFLDTHSAVARPTRTDLVRSDGQRLATLATMDIGRLETIGYVAPEEYVVKANDGATDLWGVMYKPFDFDPSKSYPVLEYIYGGPQTITAQRAFAVNADRYHHPIWALAHLGYVVVCLDARGTPGRSKAFQDAVYRNWSVGIPDHVAGMRELLARHSWLDAGRVGIFGHSWGGHSSLAALIEAPDLYRAAVSSAPGPDPLDMIIWEPYLDLPARDRTPYDRANLITQVHKITGRLMLVVGTADHANINTTFRLVKALVDEQIDHELVVLPGAGHVFEDGDRAYYLEKLRSWFDRHVKHRTGG